MKVSFVRNEFIGVRCLFTMPANEHGFIQVGNYHSVCLLGLPYMWLIALRGGFIGRLLLTQSLLAAIRQEMLY